MVEIVAVNFALARAPQRTATPVDGGYHLNGKWNYNSAGEQVNRVAVSAVVPGATAASDPADVLLALIPREGYDIFDNWYVMDMCGAGFHSGGPIKRIDRDLSSIRTHYIMAADRSAENWGVTYFGSAEHMPY